MSKNFSCRKCPAIGQGDISPSKGGCPSGGLHEWDMIGEVGSKNFSCSTCGSMVSSKTTPRGTCYKTKKSHKWS